MKEKKSFIVCILCPRGCQLEVIKNEKEYIVKGSKCNKGKGYAIKELTNPTRTLTSTVKTTFKDFPRLPVRTSEEVPLNDIFKYMNEINNVIIKERLNVGDIVIKNILNSNIDLISTDDMIQ